MEKVSAEIFDEYSKLTNIIIRGDNLECQKVLFQFPSSVMTIITLMEENSTARASVTGVATRLLRVTGRVPELRMSSSMVRGPESEGTRPKFNIS